MKIWLTDDCHNVLWNVLNMQHITTKLEKMGLFRHPWCWYGKFKGSAQMVEGDHRLREKPYPHPQVPWSIRVNELVPNNNKPHQKVRMFQGMHCIPVLLYHAPARMKFVVISVVNTNTKLSNFHSLCKGTHLCKTKLCTTAHQINSSCFPSHPYNWLNRIFPRLLVLLIIKIYGSRY